MNISKIKYLIFFCFFLITSNSLAENMHGLAMHGLPIHTVLEKYLPYVNPLAPKGGTLKVKQIGMQPGENLHEKVLSDGISSEDSDKFTIEEIKEMI